MGDGYKAVHRYDSEMIHIICSDGSSDHIVGFIYLYFLFYQIDVDNLLLYR